MVKKIMKHELYALFRVILWISLAVVLFAAISRLLLSQSLMQSSSAGPKEPTLIVATIFLIAFYVFSIGALVVATWVISVVRFYKSLFTGEGYMTLALPATADQLIWGKMLSAIIAMFYSAVVSLLSLFILFVGSVGDAIGISDLITSLYQLFEDITGSGVLLFVERLLIAVLALPMSLLILYAGMSLGQLFTSRRVLMILLIFAAVYVGTNVFSVLAVTPLSGFLYYSMGDAAEHVLAWMQIVLYAAVDVGCFFLVRYILRNKVNLLA